MLNHKSLDVENFFSKKSTKLVFFLTSKYCDETLNMLTSLKKNSFSLFSNAIGYVLDEGSEKCIKDFGVATKRIKVDLADGAKFGSINFAKITRWKITAIKEQLAAGHDVLYLDSDIVVMKNLEPYFADLQEDLAFQCDDLAYTTEACTNRTKGCCKNVCTGVIWARNTKIVKEFVQDWEKSHLAFLKSLEERPRRFKRSDQGTIIPIFKKFKERVQIAVLPTSLFPNGGSYFGYEPRNYQGFWKDKKKANKVMLIHSNWMVKKKNKEARFKKHNLWFL